VDILSNPKSAHWCWFSLSKSLLAYNITSFPFLNHDRSHTSTRLLCYAHNDFVLHIKHSPSPAAAARGKVARCYTGPLDSPVATSMIKCDPRGPLMIHCVKLYAAPDGQSFSTFGRIYSGTIKPGKNFQVSDFMQVSS